MFEGAKASVSEAAATLENGSAEEVGVLVGGVAVGIVAAAVTKGKRRGRNRLKADDNAVGPHSTFARDKDGNIYKYQTYGQTRTGHFNPTKRFDGGTAEGGPGAPHVNKRIGESIPTPHVQGKEVPGGARRPTLEELPNNKRFKDERN